ncbi:MAG: hypothetical protein RDV41_06280 [Planctomycetota bacterium]|nr:hypothetical protein [Planctomycetota bacterium]
MNYLHQNPVKHGYVDRMDVWSWSSVHEYLRDHDDVWVAKLIEKYPPMDYGRGWDEF